QAGQFGWDASVLSTMPPLSNKWTGTNEPELGWERSSLMARTNTLRQTLLSSKWLWTIFVLLLASLPAQASEADLAIPNLWEHGSFKLFGGDIPAGWLLLVGSAVICGTLGFSLYLRTQIHKLPAHRSMLNVAETIFQTCKTYLIQQGKFLLML